METITEIANLPILHQVLMVMGAAIGASMTWIRAHKPSFVYNLPPHILGPLTALATFLVTWGLEIQAGDALLKAALDSLVPALSSLMMTNFGGLVKDPKNPLDDVK